MAERYADRATFRTVYIKEAHAEDEWHMESNVKDDVCYAQPKTFDARLRIARDFVERFDYQIPLYVDGVDDAALADAAQLSSLADETPEDARSSSWPRIGTASVSGPRASSRKRTSSPSPRRPGCPESTWTACRSAREPRPR